MDTKKTRNEHKITAPITAPSLDESTLVKSLAPTVEELLSRKTKKDNAPKNFSLIYLDKKLSEPLNLLDVLGQSELKTKIVDTVIDKFFRSENRISIAKGLESYTPLMHESKRFFNENLFELLVKNYDSKTNTSTVSFRIENAKDKIDTIEQDEKGNYILRSKSNVRILPSVNFTDLDKRQARQEQEK